MERRSFLLNRSSDLFFSRCLTSLAFSRPRPRPFKKTQKTATTAVKRNPNFGKLQAGYLFPEVSLSVLVFGFFPWNSRERERDGEKEREHPLSRRQKKRSPSNPPPPPFLWPPPRPATDRPPPPRPRRVSSRRQDYLAGNRRHHGADPPFHRRRDARRRRRAGDPVGVLRVRRRAGEARAAQGRVRQVLCFVRPEAR